MANIQCPHCGDEFDYPEGYFDIATVCPLYIPLTPAGLRVAMERNKIPNTYRRARYKGPLFRVLSATDIRIIQEDILFHKERDVDTGKLKRYTKLKGFRDKQREIRQAKKIAEHIQTEPPTGTTRGDEAGDTNTSRD
jgi:hypothetical protein